jgi:hypothetical protein
MKWTDEPPSEPGWYWIQMQEGGYAEVVEVDRDGVARRTDCSTFDVGDNITVSPELWAGPITCPPPLDSEEEVMSS